MTLFCKSYDDILLNICTCAQPSLCEAAALLVDELLDPVREIAAQAIDVEGGVDLCATLSQTRRERQRCFFPSFGRHCCSEAVPQP